MTQERVKLTTRVTSPLFLNVSENRYELLGIVFHLVIIVGHTGKGPKAQNNKEGALKAEAAACIGSPVLFFTPPPSPPRGPAPWGTGIDFQDEWEEGLGFDDEDEENAQLYF